MMFSGASGSGTSSKSKPSPSIGNPHRKTLAVDGHRKADLFIRVVPIAVDHRVDHRLADRHADLHQVVFVEACTLGHADRKLFGVVDAFQCRIQKPLYGFRYVVLIFRIRRTARKRGQNEPSE